MNKFIQESSEENEEGSSKDNFHFNKDEIRKLRRRVKIY